MSISNIETNFTRTYKLFLAATVQETYHDKRLFIYLVFDNGLKHSHLHTSIPLKMNSTFDEQSKLAADYALRYAPPVDAELEVFLYYTLPGNYIDLAANSGITAEAVSRFKNPAVPLLTEFARDNSLYR
jgi:hypothetical protein